MKKKILTIFMAIATTLCCAVGLVACGGDNSGAGSGSGGEEEIDIQPPHAPSEGLEYELIEDGREYKPHPAASAIDLEFDGACYAVVGMGTCTDTDLVIPSTHDGLPVVAVGNKFENPHSAYPDIISVYIPNSIIYLQNYAFVSCHSLKSILMGTGIKNINNYYIFSDCPALEIITVASGNKTYHCKNNCLIETASKTLIAGCKNSVIPDDGSVTTIANDAFDGCISLESITIPNSVTSIGYGALTSCFSLKSIYILNNVISIGDWAFYYCTSFSLINFKGTKAQWKAVEKGEGWNWNTGDYTVQCTDGKLDKAGNEIE